MNQTQESVPEDIRLKRLRIRSWRRGIKEMDLILGAFCDEELAGLPGRGSHSLRGAPVRE